MEIRHLTGFTQAYQSKTSSWSVRHMQDFLQSRRGSGGMLRASLGAKLRIANVIESVIAHSCPRWRIGADLDTKRFLDANSET